MTADADGAEATAVAQALPRRNGAPPPRAPVHPHEPLLAIEPNGADHFVSGLSGPRAMQLIVELVHDLRSPLTAILCLSETLMRGDSGVVNDLQRSQLGMVYAGALGLSRLANDVVELAEGGGQLVDTEPAALSVREVFESVADMVRPIADDKALDLRISAPGDDLRIGHRSALSRVLLNLSTNALRFTDEGYVEISATPSPDGRLRFSVRDTGPGIPVGTLANIARPFRTSRARNEYLLCQTGLGLTICQRLLRAMDSELEVETQPGLGTCFHFGLDLPAARARPTRVSEDRQSPFPDASCRIRLPRVGRSFPGRDPGRCEPSA